MSTIAGSSPAGGATNETMKSNKLLRIIKTKHHFKHTKLQKLHNLSIVSYTIWLSSALSWSLTIVESEAHKLRLHEGLKSFIFCCPFGPAH